MVCNMSGAENRYFYDLQMIGKIIKYTNMINLPTGKQKVCFYKFQRGMLELRLRRSCGHAECVKSVADILLRVDVPVLSYYHLL